MKIRRQRVRNNKFHTFIYLRSATFPAALAHPTPTFLPPKIETNTPAHWRSACRRVSLLFFARSPAGVCDRDCRELCYCCALCPGPAGTSFILPTLPTVQLYEAVTLLYVPAISWQSLMHATLHVLAAVRVRVRVRGSEKGSHAE